MLRLIKIVRDEIISKIKEKRRLYSGTVLCQNFQKRNGLPRLNNGIFKAQYFF